MTQAVSAVLAPDDVSAILRKAKELGFEGWGGACGEAAIAINRVLFGGAGQLVAAFNEPFLDHGRKIGHVAVMVDGQCWDADGEPKDLEDVESWGMLDPADEDHVEEAERLGFKWDEDAAYAAALFEIDDETEVLSDFGADRLEVLVDILRRVRQEHECGQAAAPAV